VPPKPGAVTLAEALPTSKGRLPLLVTENYGRGRTAVFATGGSWRWQMLQTACRHEPTRHSGSRCFVWLVQGNSGAVGCFHAQICAGR